MHDRVDGGTPEAALLARALGRASEQGDAERVSSDGNHQEGLLKALGESDEWVRIGVCSEVVLGAEDGGGRDDGDAEGSADLEAPVAKAGGDP